jgi:hypothetical protein
MTYTLINTSLQRGGDAIQSTPNRFSGFEHGVEAVETAWLQVVPGFTSLKRGVNERSELQ